MNLNENHMYYYGLHISDLHFGSVDNSKFINELNNVFFKYINENYKHLDYITINGDLFDRKIGLNEKYSKSVIAFVDKLSQLIAKTNNHIKIRIIKGTKTHDFNQLSNFKYLEIQYPNNFRIINVFELEELFNNFKVLYLPEEYMEDQNEYYKDIKEKLAKEPCNIILGHGTWDVFAFDNQREESERNIKGSPVLKFDEWKNLTTGPIIFGHIHNRNSYLNKLYYTGSFSRWQFGEDDPKGFMVSAINKIDNDYKVEYINNIEAYEYKTFKLSEFINEKEKDIDKAIKKIDKLKDKYFKVKIKVDVKIPDENKAILKESFSNNEGVKLENKNNLKDKEVDDKYKFLDDNNSAIKNIQLFVKASSNYDLSEDEIKHFLIEE